MRTGTTLMINSSIAPASRNEAITPPPTIIQMFLPGAARSRWANEAIGWEMNSTPETALAGRCVEYT